MPNRHVIIWYAIKDSDRNDDYDKLDVVARYAWINDFGIILLECFLHKTASFYISHAFVFSLILSAKVLIVPFITLQNNSSLERGHDWTNVIIYTRRDIGISMSRVYMRYNALQALWS